MADALFYSPTQIKEDTPLSKNVDDKYLTETILYCQDIYIQKKIGSTLYDELKSDVNASTLTGVNKTLMDNYIRKALKWYVMAETVYEVSFPVTNKGVVSRDGEASTAADRRAIDLVYERYKNKAEHYTQRLINFLCENDTDYPSYTDPGSGADVIHPDKDMAFSSTLYLGGTKKRYKRLRDKYE